jgi:hypothetical protein
LAPRSVTDVLVLGLLTLSSLPELDHPAILQPVNLPSLPLRTRVAAVSERLQLELLHACGPADHAPFPHMRQFSWQAWILNPNPLACRREHHRLRHASLVRWPRMQLVNVIALCMDAD